MSNESVLIDTRNIKQADCEPKDFPLQELGLTERPNGFQLVVHRSVLNAMKEHGRTSMHAEVGGMFVGNLYWDGEPFLIVKASIIGKYTDGNVASVTFTAETWNHVWQEQEKYYPDTNIIGWYHTHPGFGIFLSQMDLFICKYTFNAPHQIAYVYDPQSEDDGWFIWKNSRPIKIKPLIIEDVPALPVTVHSQSRKNNILQAAADKIVISPDDTEQKWTAILITITITSIVLFLVSTICLGYLINQSLKMQTEIVQLNRKIEELDSKFKYINLHPKYGTGFERCNTNEGQIILVSPKMQPNFESRHLNEEKNKHSQLPPSQGSKSYLPN
jgi:proteasome lid subunit RPN8/RPN11